MGLRVRAHFLVEGKYLKVHYTKNDTEMVTIRGSGNGWQDIVSALFGYKHTHLSDLSSLVVVVSCLFSVLTKMM